MRPVLCATPSQLCQIQPRKCPTSHTTPTRAPPKSARVHSLHGRYPWNAWIWWPRGTAFLGPMRQTVLGRLPSPRDCTDNRLKPPLVFLWKNCSLRVGFRFTTHGRATEVLSVNIGWRIPSLSSQLASPQPAGTSQKEAQTFLGIPEFAIVPKGRSSRAPGLDASRVYDCSLPWLYIFAYLEDADWGASFQSAWN